VSDVTGMGWDWQVRPKGWLRMVGSLFGPIGGRMERRIWRSRALPAAADVR